MAKYCLPQSNPPRHTEAPQPPPQTQTSYSYLQPNPPPSPDPHNITETPPCTSITSYQEQEQGKKHIQITLKESIYTTLQTTNSIITTDRPIRINLITKHGNVITWTLGKRKLLPGYICATRRRMWECDLEKMKTGARPELAIEGRLEACLGWLSIGNVGGVRILVGGNLGGKVRRDSEDFLLPPGPDRWYGKVGGGVEEGKEILDADWNIRGFVGVGGHYGKARMIIRSENLEERTGLAKRKRGSSTDFTSSSDSVVDSGSESAAEILRGDFEEDGADQTVGEQEVDAVLTVAEQEIDDVLRKVEGFEESYGGMGAVKGSEERVQRNRRGGLGRGVMKARFRPPMTACGRCRKLKRKCPGDGEHECDRCTSRGLSCEYTQQIEKAVRVRKRL